MSRGAPGQIRGLLEALERGPAEGRRELANYLAGGRWFDTPEGYEADVLRTLVADESVDVRNAALNAVLRLSQRHPELALDIALNADIGSHAKLASDLCMAIHQVADALSGEQVAALLAKLQSVPELDYWCQEVLAKVAPMNRGAVLDLLLARATAGGDVHLSSLDEHDADLLGGAEGDELLAMLRRVRDACLSETLDPFVLGQLFWRLSDDLDARLLVLHEWLTSGEPEKLRAAEDLMHEMRWDTALIRPYWVADILAAARLAGTAYERDVRGLLFDLTVYNGPHGRPMGAPSPRNLRLRNDGARIAGLFPPASSPRQFFEQVAEAGVRALREDELEDAEYPEGRR